MYRLSLRFIVIVSLITFSMAVLAGEPGRRMTVSPSAIEWDSADHQTIVLRVQSPDGEIHEQTFRGGQKPVFRLSEQATDGAYNYELRNTRDDRVQSGTITVLNGAFLSSDAAEAKPAREVASNSWRDRPVGNPDLTGDTYIIGGQLCVGQDCTGSESLGFKTILLRENNNFIHFEDTSTAAGFASNDWRIQINDTSSGGANKFTIEDVTSAKVPFFIEGNSPTNTVYLDSTGRVGFRTSTPALDLHVAAPATPGLRLDQTSGTLQVWDVAANNLNFFVRDVTAGNTQPFRIRTGAPTSSLDIASSGNVGLNCDAPGSDLVIASGAGCSNPSSSLNAGDTQFTAASSRTFKENIHRVDVPNVLEKLEKIDVYQYDFIGGPKDRVGLIAEDFHTIFERGSEKYINGSEVQMALWLAVKELAAQNKELRERLEALEKK